MAEPRDLGYLIPQFPGQTHIFFWRELKALETLGFRVVLMSTRDQDKPGLRPRCTDLRGVGEAPGTPLVGFRKPLSSDKLRSIVAHNDAPPQVGENRGQREANVSGTENPRFRLRPAIGQEHLNFAGL